MYFVRFGNGEVTTIYENFSRVKHIYEIMEVCEHDHYINLNGSYIDLNDEITENSTYTIIPRVRGGKGGFGSMLRAIGAQIEKTTNHEACRDLSGRRMRDVNNEKQLRDWVAKAAERETMRRRKRQERHDKRHARPSHRFDEDGEYTSQRSKVTEQLQQALDEGLKKASNQQDASDAEVQNNNETSHSLRIKRACQWLGIDSADLSDLSSESDTEEDEVSSKIVKFTLPPPCEVPKPRLLKDTDASTGQSELGSTIAEPGNDSAQEDCISSIDANSTMADASMLVDCSYVSSVDDLSSMATGDNTLLDDSKTDTEEIKIKILTEEDVLEVKEASDLESYGLDALKNYLQSRGLKCGGTLEERCQRIFSVKGLKKEDIDPAFFAGKQRVKKNK